MGCNLALCLDEIGSIGMGCNLALCLDEIGFYWYGL